MLPPPQFNYADVELTQALAGTSYPPPLTPPPPPTHTHIHRVFFHSVITLTSPHLKPYGLESVYFLRLAVVQQKQAISSHFEFPIDASTSSLVVVYLLI